ncbi:hypothetical protein [Rhizobium oryzicola]|uniref:Uncharacterized protein n=1 Tax=Rhizobium oryzicola TaxID=1232668 RepID=A0ABT8SUK0_9HYPH|nr:hypothetical protein [Rhizobium oryzicola]MDO1582122.1 hypothetical protein [Rhizobium oryzicola]
MILCLLIEGAAPSAFGRDLPADVDAFVAMREQCDHFRSEPGGDASRDREIAKALRTYCRGTDAELKSLKQKYRKGPSAVRALLDGFDDQIE